MTRLEANLALIKILTEFVKDYPDIRFAQALRSIGVFETTGAVSHDKMKGHLGEVQVFYSNEFYTESEETLKKVKERLKKE